MISLILDTDIGDDVDDVFALAYVARHPDIGLMGVSTVIGDTSWRAAIALRLLDMLGVSDVPGTDGHVADAKHVQQPKGNRSAPGSVTDDR